MKFIFLLSCSIFFASCNSRKCDPDDFVHADWTKQDSTYSFFICPATGSGLSAGDSVEITYLGEPVNGKNILLQKELDGMIFLTLTGIKEGRFISSDTNLAPSVRSVIGKMNKGSIGTIRYDLSEYPLPGATRMVTLYFKHETDSTVAAKWLAELKTQPYYDSIKYISANAAMEKWDAENDTTWKEFLSANPLPAYAEVYLKDLYFDTAQLSVLKEKYLQSGLVSEVNYPAISAGNSLKTLLSARQTKYLIRITGLK